MKSITKARFFSFLIKDAPNRKIMNEQCFQQDDCLPQGSVQIKKSLGSRKYLCGECLDWLEIEIVIQMQIVEVFAVNKKVEHVVALAANL